MKPKSIHLALGIVAGCLVIWAMVISVRSSDEEQTAGREKVVFWHFWGGAERQVVRDIVGRFNDSQDRYYVEEVPVPGQNLDMKFFMALAGGDFPDLLNQDDQIIAQWAERDVLTPIRELAASNEKYQQLLDWLNPAARRIGTYDDELYALCNAIDIRAFFYRTEALGLHPPPTTIEQLDAIALQPTGDESRIPYLPDDRRLWAWGIVFGGEFYDAADGRVTANHPGIVAALEWMVSYSRFHGLQKIRAFRSTNREAGAGSMLIDGRYGLMMDGQWRVAELDAYNHRIIEENQAGGRGKVLVPRELIDYGVVPLPAPADGRDNAGWVNGNFFVVPRGCKNPEGAWEFMKFWAGFGGHESHAARSAAAGGWIPASRHVVEQPAFQEYLRDHPNFRLFVDLSESESQVPTPPVPVQAYFFERVNLAVEEALSLSKTPQQALDDATRDIQSRLDAVREGQQ